jgi:hypothetical protein
MLRCAMQYHLIFRMLGKKVAVVLFWIVLLCALSFFHQNHFL